MGERAGNSPLESTVAVINDFMPEVSIAWVNETSLSSLVPVETFTGYRIPANKPIVGDNALHKTAGIHADGDNKNNLYFNDLLPERFGRKRQYTLEKTVKQISKRTLQELGLKLNQEDIKLVTQRIINWVIKRKL
jgi:D-citramalate synthase